MNKGEKATCPSNLGPDFLGVQWSQQASPILRIGLLLLLILFGLVLASCDSGATGSTPAAGQDTAGSPASRGQGGTPGRVAPPSPSATPARPGTGLRADREEADKSATTPLVVTATDPVAATLAPGWRTDDSISQVFDLAFAPEGSLWVLTPSGLARWDAPGTAEEACPLFSLEPGQPGLWAGPLAFGPDGQVRIGATRFRP